MNAEEKVLDVLDGWENNGKDGMGPSGTSRWDIAFMTGLTMKQVSSTLQRLKKKGLVEGGRGDANEWFWWRTKEVSNG